MSRTDPSSKPVESWRDHWFRPRKLFKLAFLAAIPVLGPWAVRQLPDLYHQPEYRVAFQSIRLDPPPESPVPANLVAQVQRAQKLPEELLLLDPSVPRQLAEAFAGHPWVTEVKRVRQQYPAQITVELSYRQPVALIRVPTGVYPVDAQAVLLPPSDLDAASLGRFVPILGVTSSPQGPAGQPWGDPVVAAAAKLAEFLGPRWKDLHLSVITVRTSEDTETDGQDRVQFEFQTTGGSRILWGRSPGSAHPGELAASQKLGRIERYLTEFGSFDQPHGPYEIDIRHWKEISRRSLTASKPTTRTRRQ